MKLSTLKVKHVKLEKEIDFFYYPPPSIAVPLASFSHPSRVQKNTLLQVSKSLV